MMPFAKPSRFGKRRGYEFESLEVMSLEVMSLEVMSLEVLRSLRIPLRSLHEVAREIKEESDGITAILL